MKKTSKKSKISRSIRMRLVLGDDNYEYIKDEIGIEVFLEKQFQHYYKEQKDIIKNRNIRDFFVYWILIVSYYKYKFGKSVRDADAIKELKLDKEFREIDTLYSFRNCLFKFDFDYNMEFKKKLNDNVMKLKLLVKFINEERKIKEKYMINNKEW